MDPLAKLTYRAERNALANPMRYRMELFAFGLLGYCVIFFALAGVLGILLGLLWMIQNHGVAAFVILFKTKLIFVLLPIAWILLKSLWIKVEHPTGFQLQRSAAKKLFVDLDAMVKELKTPKIHQVILTQDFNAAISQTPRLGILGWQKNTLFLGLELLLVCSPEQAKAIVAHELGHLSGNHSRFSAWIYRVRMSWLKIMVSLQHQGTFGASLMSRFFEWYQPRFDAYSFALARLNEYEADAISAELTSREHAAQALVKVYVYSSKMGKLYWEPFYQQADSMPRPKYGPWHSLRKFLNQRKGLDDNNYREEVNRELKKQLSEKTSYVDTHPSLGDRLHALEVKASIPELSSSSAAEYWFGKSYKRTLKKFDRQWYKENKSGWRERYQYIQEAKQRLVTLSKKDEQDISDEEMWEKAQLVHEVIDQTCAEPIYRHFQDRQPQHPQVAYLLGQLELERGEQSGLEQLKIAIRDENLVLPACNLAYGFAELSKDTKEMEWWEGVANLQISQNQEDYEDRYALLPTDHLLPADISADLRIHIRVALKKTRKVKHAWIAQKQTKFKTAEPALAIAFEQQGTILSRDLLVRQLHEAIALDLTIYIVPNAGDYQALANRIMDVGENLF